VLDTLAHHFASVFGAECDSALTRHLAQGAEAG
jgi:hypothetical protein